MTEESGITIEKTESAKVDANNVMESIKGLNSEEKEIAQEVLVSFFLKDGPESVKKEIKKQNAIRKRKRLVPLTENDKKARLRGSFFEQSAKYLLEKEDKIEDTEFSDFVLEITRNPKLLLDSTLKLIQDLPKAEQRKYRETLRELDKQYDELPRNPRNNDAISITLLDNPVDDRRQAVLTHAFEMKNFNLSKGDSSDQLRVQLGGSHEDMRKIVHAIFKIYPAYRQLKGLENYPDVIRIVSEKSFKQVVVQPEGVIEDERKKDYESEIGDYGFIYTKLNSHTLHKIYTALTPIVLRR